jgi:hypothetical protein
VAAFLFAAFSASLWHQDGCNALLCAGLGLIGWVMLGVSRQNADAVIAPVSKRRQVSGQALPKRPYIRKAQRIQMRWEKIFNTAVDCGMAGQEIMLRSRVKHLREKLRRQDSHFMRELNRLTEYKGTVQEVRDNTWNEVKLFLDQNRKELNITIAENARLKKDMELLLDTVSVLLVEKVEGDSPPKRASVSSPGGCSRA